MTAARRRSTMTLRNAATYLAEVHRHIVTATTLRWHCNKGTLAAEKDDRDWRVTAAELKRYAARLAPKKNGE